MTPNPARREENVVPSPQTNQESNAPAAPPPVAQNKGSEQLLTAKDVAQMLRVPTTWVYRAARDGDLPVVACGRYRRFDRNDVRRWIEAQKTATHAA